MSPVKLLTAALGVIAMVSIGAIFLMNRSAGQASVAQIFMDGELVREIDLSQISAPDTIAFDWPGGGHTTIEVAPNQIRVAQADCPDQICVHQGWISDGVTPIVCLPYRLVIQLTNGGDILDAATH